MPRVPILRLSLTLSRLVLCGLVALGATEPARAVTGESVSPPQGGARGEAGLGRMYKGSIEPHWFHGNSRFWYRNELPGDTSEFVLVDAEAGTRGPAFDHTRLAAALSAAAGATFQGERLPFRQIEFIDEAAAIRFEAAGRTWKCLLEAYSCTPTDPGAPAAAPADDASPDARRRRRRAPEGDGGAEPEVVASPNGRWVAYTKEHNIFIKSSDPGEAEIQLSDDGSESMAYAGRPEWSPDSATLVAWRLTEREEKLVHLIESSPSEGGRARLKSRPYTLPGDSFPTYELTLYDVANRARTRPAVDRFEHEWLRPRVRWNQAGDRFVYEQVDRGHQRLRVIEVETRTGAARSLIDELSNTFIWTTHTEELRLERLTWLKNSDEAIYVSERDGWRHAYLVDARQGGLTTPITHGDFVVRGIDRIDEEQRQLWFTASGREPGQDPYLRQYYRVNFDGTGMVALTEGDGDHSVQYSPDRRFVIDTWSRVDQPPAHTLRRAVDGALLCCLESADVSELKAAGWVPPEVFSAKGRDGVTDIWGLIARPPDFDPAKKYPVIEDIYAGPHGSFVPKRFHPGWRHESLTRLGFIVVQIDGMGTANRSKAFHDVCWKNLKDAGFPDRILWMKAAAARYPEMDVSRVGIFGTSAGGQSAAGALLFHPEFYKVAVANCGCHDNRMDKASWNEQWMGYPVGPQYAESSNIENAHRLQGKLFLIVGELDSNVPPESTLRLADALIRADKDFDLLVVPGGGHGAGGAYGRRRLQDFFVRHLQGVEPPNRNAAAKISQ